MSKLNNHSTDNGKIFLKYFLLSFILFSLTVFTWKRADIFPWIGSCVSEGYRHNSFLSYCHSNRYGDYEHRAFWHQLEPGLIENVKNAKVLFLGNSRAQYAFSTDAVSRYFKDHKLSHYVFGFGMGSQNYVPEKMAEKFNLQPQVLIVNTDPFFTDYISQTNLNMLDESQRSHWEYNVKGWLQKKQRAICNNHSTSLIHKLLCSGKEETLFRNRSNGHWNVKYFRKNKKIPVAKDNIFTSAEDIDKAVIIATHFIESFKIDSECLILTVTPRTSTPLAFAKALSSRLEVPGIFPFPNGLLTVDDSHLDPDSAERWSEEFLQQASTVIEKCTMTSG